MRRKRIHKGYKYVYICVDVVRKNIFNILSLIWYYYWHASETSLKMISEGGETGRSISYLASSMQNAFSFKLQDRKGRLHRFTCGMLTITCFQSCLSVYVCFTSLLSLLACKSANDGYLSLSWMWLVCMSSIYWCVNLLLD